MPQFLEKLVDKLGTARLLAVPAGAIVAFLSAFAFWFLFQLKNFSSAIRDSFEQPPGPLQYVAFAAACVLLLVSFWLGLCSIVIRARRRGGA
jgi:hypothetical protein